MSETQTVKVSFKNQASDLCKLIKYFGILRIKETERSSRFLKTKDQTNGFSVVVREHSIYADNTADPVIKGNLKLLPAVIDFSFSVADKENSFTKISLPFRSDFVQNYEHGLEDTDIWYQTAVLRQFEFNKSVGLTQIKFENEWQAYYPVESADSEDEFIYVHFPETDSWLAFRFDSLGSDTRAVQILNRTKNLIIEQSDLACYFDIASTNGYFDISERYYYLSEHNEELADNKFFDLSKLYSVAEDQIDSFKMDQDDPFIDADELDSKEINFLCGSEEELERMVILICHAAIPLHVWDNFSDTLEVQVQSAMDDGESACIDYENMSYSHWDTVREELPTIITSIENALDAVLDNNTPSGHSWEYNDGAYDRESGYDKSPCRLSITVTKPSAHEQVCAKMEIKKLASVFGKETIDSLLNQKE